MKIENEELEVGKRGEEVEMLVGVGGENHLYFVIQCQGGVAARLSYMRREGGKWQGALLQCPLNAMGAL